MFADAGLGTAQTRPLGLGQTASLDAALSAIMANPRTPHALYALEVYDLDAQRPLYAQTFATAASTTKLVTEGTSLALLGPDFRSTTPVYRTGSIDKSGTLHGNVVLVGTGDPNLSQRVGADNTLTFENEDHPRRGRARRSAHLRVHSVAAGQLAATPLRASMRISLRAFRSPSTSRSHASDRTISRPGAS